MFLTFLILLLTLPYLVSATFKLAMGSQIPSNFVSSGIIQANLIGATDIICMLKNRLKDFGEINIPENSFNQYNDVVRNFQISNPSFDGYYYLTFPASIIVGFTGVRKGDGDTCIYIPFYKEDTDEYRMLNGIVKVLYDSSPISNNSYDIINKIIQITNKLVYAWNNCADLLDTVIHNVSIIFYVSGSFFVLFLLLQILCIYYSYSAKTMLYSLYKEWNSLMDSFGIFKSTKNNLSITSPTYSVQGTIEEV